MARQSIRRAFRSTEGLKTRPLPQSSFAKLRDIRAKCGLRRTSVQKYLVSRFCWKFEAGSERGNIANSAVVRARRMSRDDFGGSKDTSAGYSSAFLHTTNDAIDILVKWSIPAL